MHHVEANLFEQIECVLELFFGLATEADDDVRRERDAGPPVAQPADQVAILVMV